MDNHAILEILCDSTLQLYHLANLRNLTIPGQDQLKLLNACQMPHIGLLTELQNVTGNWYILTGLSYVLLALVIKCFSYHCSQHHFSLPQQPLYHLELICKLVDENNVPRRYPERVH